MAITKLSDMTESQRDKFMDYYNNVLLTGLTGFKYEKPTEEFDEFGLRFSSDYLAAIQFSAVMLPIELMADYVDEVIKTEIDKNNTEFIYKNIIDVDTVVNSVNEINATACGNMAYIVLHCKNEIAVKKVEAELNTFHTMVKGHLLNYMNENM